ncbi:unnamed protein product [Effrenium voratum]|nr:unnamed protein product [Effrenium voratum]|mmetsp:Transcript_77208/g.184857  ORF Transcript_77208/g.184857 Transcript_77208/m.184857 type:complete len:302 (+) Transcript_77208:22-927(+)|eukprot:CAMPEP_0181459750 /NCGR_PEP_ID=MMETSP1110-20121109/32985_1 /TAXON_ID=174948 /ORGANISM="Symbiodinium sp., Strain CCMP421" /LENGTH=301 /DNA_ID=CAMNT_0023584277 /DNA_START=20 /DNA_END=925 /DNA_ORIENTATION=+
MAALRLGLRGLRPRLGLRFMSLGPDTPKAEAAGSGLPRWPAGWHDMLQYHFFFEDMFVQARVFLTPSLEEHSLWIFDHATQKVVELENSKERLQQSEGEHLAVQGPRLQISDGPGGGKLALGKDMAIEFKNRHVYSWLPAGMTDELVIHRPDLELSMTYDGRTRVGRGYSKRYFGHYGPHWGYRFIQSSWLGSDKFLWTADATFRLGDGEAKYNYFKLLDGAGELTQADSRDTYQQDCEGFATINGTKYVARVTPLGEWLHDYKGGDTNSRMQLRYCKLHLSCGGETFEGYALNERCFGVL